MKAIRPLLISTLLAFGFTSSAALAGEPNMSAFGNDHPTVKTDKNNKSGSSTVMSGGDCPPKSIHEKDAQHTGTRHTEQHTGVLKE